MDGRVDDRHEAEDTTDASRQDTTRRIVATRQTRSEAELHPDDAEDGEGR